MFYLLCDEVKDRDFQESFALIMKLLVETLQENLFLTKELLDQIITDLMKKLPGYIMHRLRLDVS